MQEANELKATRTVGWQTLILALLSLSIGWGIRGNFGHEWGAAFPGALTAMAVVLLSGRADWERRIPFFALFGAIGWSFGGSISYMKVIAFTHSGDSLSVWYGFVCLFIIGFLWGAVGGAGTALPAYLDRKRLTELLLPILILFGTLWVSEMILNLLFAKDPRLEDRLDWFDTDWLALLIALGATLVRATVLKKFDRPGVLFLYLIIGWWIGFLLFPVLLHIRMTPPRGDSWAGCVGLVAGMFLYLARNGLGGVTYAGLVSGFIGGLGFATADLIKLLAIKSGYETNWHSVLEQTYGAINGIGVAVAMSLPRRHAPPVTEESSERRWAEPLAVALVLILLTYVNLQKIVNDWTKAKTVPETLYFLTAHGWFDLAYLGIALVGCFLLWEHTRRPFPLVPPSWRGKGLMLYLALLWWMVLGNLLRIVVSFAPQRLVTEGTIHLNALICTLLVMLWTRNRRPTSPTPLPSYTPALKKALQVGLIGMALTTTLDWAMMRVVWGNQPASNATLHIRFGPRATTNQK